MRAQPPVRSPRHVPLVHMVRDGIVEGVHHGSAVVLGSEGNVEFAAGDVEAAFYPRSAFKPVQVVGMLRAGLDLSGGLLAVSTASHSGEEQHITAVRGVLNRAGLAEEDLLTPADLPMDPWVRSDWIARGRGPRPLAHNCSGKHAAMLLTSVNRGWSTENYLDPKHPVQEAIAEAAAELTGEAVAKVSVDGCGAPLFAVSLLGLTRAFARIARGAATSEEGALARAMAHHPEMVSGIRRDCSDLMRTVPGLIAKDGFEAVQVAALPDGRAVGVKIADGSDRARMPATAAALAVSGVDPSLLAGFADAPVLGGDLVVGRLSAVGELAAAAERSTSAFWPPEEKRGPPAST